MKHYVTIIFLFISLPSFALVETAFHPFDNSLEKSAELILGATESIDLALYNLDVTDESPVIQAFKSNEVQAKLKTGALKARILFEGYSTKKENFKKMAALEQLGIDARYMGMSRRLHHKFAIIDFATTSPVLITGSANWSLSSQKNYNENVLYFENQPGITSTFQDQFNLLWSKAKEYGFAQEYTSDFVFSDLETGLNVYFNTENLKETDSSFRKDSTKEGFTLTRQIVRVIEEAQESIEIATTRIMLRPIYEALLNAAQRNIKINIVVTMEEYTPRVFREQKDLKICDDFYEESCSTSQNFAIFLNDKTYPGKENVKIRAKYYSFDADDYLSKQMHSKYIIVDDKKLLTGSFNWSVSAEYGHFENLIEIQAEYYPEVLKDFNSDFDRLWRFNRQNLQDFLQNTATKAQNEDFISCSFDPFVLSFAEIDFLTSGARANSPHFYQICGKERLAVKHF